MILILISLKLNSFSLKALKHIISERESLKNYIQYFFQVMCE